MHSGAVIKRSFSAEDMVNNFGTWFGLISIGDRNDIITEISIRPLCDADVVLHTAIARYGDVRPRFDFRLPGGIDIGTGAGNALDANALDANALDANALASKILTFYTRQAIEAGITDHQPWRSVNWNDAKDVGIDHNGFPHIKPIKSATAVAGSSSSSSSNTNAGTTTDSKVATMSMLGRCTGNREALTITMKGKTICDVVFGLTDCNNSTVGGIVLVGITLVDVNGQYCQVLCRLKPHTEGVRIQAPEGSWIAEVRIQASNPSCFLHHFAVSEYEAGVLRLRFSQQNPLAMPATIHTLDTARLYVAANSRLLPDEAKWHMPQWERVSKDLTRELDLAPVSHIPKDRGDWKSRYMAAFVHLMPLLPDVLSNFTHRVLVDGGLPFAQALRKLVIDRAGGTDIAFEVRRILREHLLGGCDISPLGA
jgi:hypothetical protein